MDPAESDTGSEFQNNACTDNQTRLDLSVRVTLRIRESRQANGSLLASKQLPSIVHPPIR